MTGAYSAIGTNPIGSYGLDVGNGYGSYGDPMMTGMMPGMGGMYGGMSGMYGGMSSPYGMGMASPYGMGMMGGLGMMGMMSPQYIQQMGQAQQALLQLQQQNEVSQLNHATDMHKLIQNADVQNLSIHERTIFEKAMTDGDIKNGIRNLCDVIRTGDQDAICEEYDKLKQYIYTKYADYIESNGGKMDVQSSVNDLISLLYGQICSAQSGEICDLRTDIKNYGESPFAHGFNSCFLGNSGHNEKYTEETLSYLYGTRINDKGSKSRAQKFGRWTAKGTEFLGSAAVGAGVGAGIFAAGKAIAGNMPGKLKAWVLGGAAAIGLVDTIWQLSRD